MSRSENPYEPPRAPVGEKSGKLSRSDVKGIAVSQKAILVCILIYLGMVGGQFLIPPEYRLFLAGGFLILGVTSTVFVFMLALKVYSTGVGILMGILTLIPCLGLIILLLVNARATKTLQSYGHEVGLLGADLSRF